MGVSDFLSSLWGGKEPAAEKSGETEGPPANAPAGGERASSREASGDAKPARSRKRGERAGTSSASTTLDTPPAPAPAGISQAAVGGAAAAAATLEAPAAGDLVAVLEAPFDPGAIPNLTATDADKDQLDAESVRDLYASIASNQARPIKRLVSELKRGAAGADYVEICRPILQTLAEAAQSMSLDAVARKITDVDAALSLAEGTENPRIEGEVRELILAAYEELAGELPGAFDLGGGVDRRESVLIHSLLKQVPDVGHVTFQKLYGAGLTTLDALFAASAQDLAVTTGIAEALCGQICEKLQEYRRELEGPPCDAAGRRARLADLVRQLRRQHEGFELAAQKDWSSPVLTAEKRAARSRRQNCALQISVVLADMGEIELLEAIEKLPFERRIERLEEFVEYMAEAGQGGAPAPSPARR